MVRPLLALVVLLLAGCAGPTTLTGPPTSETTTTNPSARPDPGPAPPMVSWTAHECDPSRATMVSRNAQVVPGLRGSADDLARKLGDAVGDPVSGDPYMFEDTGAWAWPTGKGRIFVHMTKPYHPSTPAHQQGDFIAASYSGSGNYTLAKATTFATSLGAETNTLKFDSRGRVWQEWAGLMLDFQPPARTGILWQNGTELLVGVGPLFKLHSQGYNITVEDAEQAASEYMRCFLDKNGNTPARGYAIRSSKAAGVAVHNETISHLVRVRYAVPFNAPCGSEDANWVYVDAWTGAVKGRDFANCA